MSYCYDIGYAIRLKKEFADTPEGNAQMMEFCSIAGKAFEFDGGGETGYECCDRLLKALGSDPSASEFYVTGYDFFRKDGNPRSTALVLCGTSPWYPDPAAMKEGLAKKFPALELLYYAEEVGCDVFENNDVDGDVFEQRYYLEYNFEDTEEWSKFYFAKGEEADALSKLSDILGIGYPSIEDALADFAGGDESRPASIVAKRHGGGYVLFKRFDEGTPA